MNCLPTYSRLLGGLIAAMLIILPGGCRIDDIPDPNGSSLDQILNNASRSDLQVLVTGTESLLGKEIHFYYLTTGIIGRDWYYFTNSDPRFTGELLGSGQSVLDDAGFYGTRPYQGRYQTVRNANILLQAVANNAERLALTQTDIQGYRGFAHAMQAYELHLALNLQYENGIRLDVADPDNPGPFLSYTASLDGILDLLVTASEELDAAGDAFPFALSTGFADFDTPASFRRFVQGLAARIAVYQGDHAAALGFLEQSFLDVTGDLYDGPFRRYSTSSGEQVNELFRRAGQSEALIAHPTWVADIAAEDDRIAKIAPRDTITLDGLTGDHDCVVYPSLTAPIWLLRNEELILLRAEARISSQPAAAVADIDLIRTSHGLAPYAGGTDEASLLDELLTQRRYSLFAEGHRWVDMRRYNRLDELPIDRPGDDVWIQLPRPVSEAE